MLVPVKAPLTGINIVGGGSLAVGRLGGGFALKQDGSVERERGEGILSASGARGREQAALKIRGSLHVRRRAMVKNLKRGGADKKGNRYWGKTPTKKKKPQKQPPHRWQEYSGRKGGFVGEGIGFFFNKREQSHLSRSFVPAT